MKNLFLIIALIIFPTLLMSQEKEQTLFGGDSIAIGFYGGPDFKFTIMDDYVAVFNGGKGGIIFDGAFSIGGAGYNLITNNHFVDVFDNGVFKSAELDMDYGGLVLEYINSTNRAFHFTVNSLIGWGVASYILPGNKGVSESVYDRSGLFVIEPGATLEMNLTKYMRMNIGGSYRLVAGSKLGYNTDSDFSGFAINLTLKFGFFNKFAIPDEIKDAIKDIREIE